MPFTTQLLATDRSQEVGWKVVSTLGGALGGIVTRRIIRSLWTSFSRDEHDPPLNPADRRIGWVPALEWAIAAGIGAGIGRMVSQRAAAAGWEAATGEPPPGIRS